MFGRAARVVVCGVVLAWTREAAADGRSFVYERSAGAEECPDEATIRRRVVERLGHDPFGEGGPSARVRIERRPEGFDADVLIREADGVVRGSRVLASTGASCDEIANAVVVTLSVALDPANMPSPRGPVTPKPAPSRLEDPFAPEPARAEPAPPSPSPPRPSTLRFRIAGGGGAAFGVAPSPSLAAAASLGARWRAFSLDLEGRIHPKTSEDADFGVVSASSSWGALVPAVHFGAFSAGAVLAGGALRGEGTGGGTTVSDSSFVAAVGVRGAAELAVSQSVGLRAGVDVLAFVRGASLVLGGKEAWSTPSFAASPWLGAVAYFP